ncbi:MAG TPA: hypothetical protein VLA92_02580 [Candidatus Saccharimonadales bacterium]|nr:hypothetical protein [Candidatus Saccharimonadales bacterium]
MKKTDLRQFDYEKVAKLDSDMWRSYYNHQFFKLFLQLIKLLRIQFRFNWFFTLKLAYYSAWAATYYRINKHKGVDNKRVLSNLTKFYAVVSRHSVEAFDYAKAAELELAWWDVHRKSVTNNPELERSLAEGAAAIYSVPVGKLTAYAHYRAEAMILPQHEGDDQPTPTDWPKVTELLVKAWKAAYVAVQK